MHKQQKIPMEKLKFNMLPSHDLNHMLRNNEFVVKKYVPPPYIFIYPPDLYRIFFIHPCKPIFENLYPLPYKGAGGSVYERIKQLRDHFTSLPSPILPLLSLLKRVNLKSDRLTSHNNCERQHLLLAYAANCLSK